jgi:hypothetical protein
LDDLNLSWRKGFEFQGFSFKAINDNSQCQRPVVRLVDGSSSGEMHQLSKEVAQATRRLLPPPERSEASEASVLTQ